MAKIQNYLLFAFILLCPVVYDMNGGSLREFQEGFYQVMGMALIATFIGNIWITLFIILNLATFLYHGGDVGQSNVMNVFIGGLIFLVSRKYWKVNNTEPMMKCLVAIGVVSVIWMGFQFIKIDPLFIGQDAGGNKIFDLPFNNPVGLFGIKMANGIFLSLIVPIVASFNILVAPLLLIPLFFAQSSVVALSLFGSMSFYLYHLHRKLFLPFILLGLVGLSAFCVLDERTDGQTFSSRFPVWHSAIKYGLHNPIGYGPDSYRNLNKHKNFVFKSDEKYNHGLEFYMPDGSVAFQYYSMFNDKAEIETKTKNKLDSGFNAKDLSMWDNPHNEYIQMFFEYGFAGLFLLIGLMHEMWYRFKFYPGRKDKELIVLSSCLIVYFISGLTQFPLHMARLGFAFPVLLGAWYSRTDYDV